VKIIDSVGWLEFFKNGPLAEDYRVHIVGGAELITPTIVVYEVTRHLLREAGSNAAWTAAGQMSKTTVVPLDGELACSAAELGLHHSLPQADAIIYATAIAYNATVVTSDAHFEGLPQVEFIPRYPAGENS
jgi:predicted nucleic acid-binding protein